ncbi:hypothetical protein K439DRAFT_1330118 [Ramaria rubella]|nr:hypothetical protein K439DRAFT_1330118 [Ramaria rubella]
MRHVNAASSGEHVPSTVPVLPLPNSRIYHSCPSYNPEDHIIPNILHPPVLAHDHFLSWLTSFGLPQMDKAAEHFPPHIVLCKRFMSHCIEPSLLRNYGAGLIRFTKFCNNFNIPEPDQMSVFEALLCTFISTCSAGPIGEGAICTWLEGLKLWYRINSAPWHGSPELKGVVEVYPITFQHINALHHHLDLTNSDVSVFAIATIAFWSCCHLGELLIDSHFDLAVHVSHSTHIKLSIASNGFHYISLHVPCTKTKSKGDDIIITNSHCPHSPTSAFNHHMLANSMVPPDAPLFLFITEQGSWSPMRHLWFMLRCNEICALDNLSSVKGHGFCIGGTTFLLLLGIDPWIPIP